MVLTHLVIKSVTRLLATGRDYLPSPGIQAGLSDFTEQSDMARVVCACSRAASTVVSWNACLSCKEYTNLLEKPLERPCDYREVEGGPAVPAFHLSWTPPNLVHLGTEYH